MAGARSPLVDPAFSPSPRTRETARYARGRPCGNRRAVPGAQRRSHPRRHPWRRRGAVLMTPVMASATWSLAAVAGIVLAFIALETWRPHLIPPAIAFTAAGLVVGTEGLGWIDASPDTGSLRVQAEVTLALGLFSDAARIDLRALRDGYALPARHRASAHDRRRDRRRPHRAPGAVTGGGGGARNRAGRHRCGVRGPKPRGLARRGRRALVLVARARYRWPTRRRPSARPGTPPRCRGAGFRR
jgi:hypothetical protein